MKYNRGVVPTLEPSTDYDELIKMKARFDNAFEQVEDERVDAPSDYASVEAKLDKLLIEKPVDDFLQSFSVFIFVNLSL
jgi:hypothetical protein